MNGMDIEIGNHYINKTWKYLLPSLKGHGELFTKKFGSIYWLAVGIHDTVVDGTNIAEGRNIYVLVDKQYHNHNFEQVLTWLRYQEDIYVADYLHDTDIKSPRKHMLVLKVPEQYHKSYDSFLKGKYSKMYTKEELSELFSPPIEARIPDLEVLSKSENAHKLFTKKLRQEFDVKFSLRDTLDMEYDFPLIKCKEIFNCQEDKRVYFNENLDKVWK